MTPTRYTWGANSRREGPEVVCRRACTFQHRNTSGVSSENYCGEMCLRGCSRWCPTCGVYLRIILAASANHQEHLPILSPQLPHTSPLCCSTSLFWWCFRRRFHSLIAELIAPFLVREGRSGPNRDLAVRSRLFLRHVCSALGYWEVPGHQDLVR